MKSVFNSVKNIITSKKTTMTFSTTKSIVTGLFLYATTLFAQEVAGFERIYYADPAPVEAEDVTFTFKNPVAQFDHCKVGFTIENNSSDFLLYDSEKSLFTYEFGTKSPAIKAFYIDPSKNKTKTLLVKGAEQYLQRAFDITIDGLVRIPIEGEIQSAPNFQLPAAVNNFTEGNFKVTLLKYGASTKEAKAVFEVTYTGNDVAIINEANLSVTAERKKTNETVTYANDNKKSDPTILHKGESTKITAVFHIPGKIVDMQFAQMNVIWNSTFVESKEIPIAPIVVKFEMDEALTKEKK